MTGRLRRGSAGGRSDGLRRDGLRRSRRGSGRRRRLAPYPWCLLGGSGCGRLLHVGDRLWSPALFGRPFRVLFRILVGKRSNVLVEVLFAVLFAWLLVDLIHGYAAPALAAPATSKRPRGRYVGLPRASSPQRSGSRCHCHSRSHRLWGAASLEDQRRFSNLAVVVDEESARRIPGSQPRRWAVGAGRVACRAEACHWTGGEMWVPYRPRQLSHTSIGNVG